MTQISLIFFFFLFFGIRCFLAPLKKTLYECHGFLLAMRVFFAHGYLFYLTDIFLSLTESTELTDIFLRVELKKQKSSFCMCKMKIFLWIK